MQFYLDLIEGAAFVFNKTSYLKFEKSDYNLTFVCTYQVL